MSKFLEENGLAYFWSKIKSYYNAYFSSKVWPIANGGTNATTKENA